MKINWNSPIIKAVEGALICGAGAALTIAQTVHFTNWKQAYSVLFAAFAGGVIKYVKQQIGPTILASQVKSIPEVSPQPPEAPKA